MAHVQNTLEQVDQLLGNKNWRAMRRRVVWQLSAGKFRAIDNAKTSLTNAGAWLIETITAVPFDIGVICAMHLLFLVDKAEWSKW